MGKLDLLMGIHGQREFGHKEHHGYTTDTK